MLEVHAQPFRFEGTPEKILVHAVGLLGPCEWRNQWVCWGRNGGSCRGVEVGIVEDVGKGWGRGATYTEGTCPHRRDTFPEIPLS